MKYILAYNQRHSFALTDGKYGLLVRASKYLLEVNPIAAKQRALLANDDAPVTPRPSPDQLKTQPTGKS